MLYPLSSAATASGSAKTVLTDLGLTIFEQLILSSTPHVVPARQWRWDDMPHEILYDRLGIAVAEELFGRTVVKREFRSIIDHGMSSDVPRLEKALRSQPTKDLSSLRRDLATFSAPYRNDLLAFWHEAQKGGRLPEANGLRSLDSLWTD